MKIDAIDYCTFGNSKPFRIKIRNILNVSDDINIPDETIIIQLEEKYRNNSLKIPTINENLSSFTYNKSDPEVETFINNYIIKL